MTRIVLIHATRVAMAPIEEAFARLWPEAETLSILEEGLSSDAASGRVSGAALDRRINALADYAMGLAPTRSCTPVRPSAAASRPPRRGLTSRC